MAQMRLFFILLLLKIIHSKVKLHFQQLYYYNNLLYYNKLLFKQLMELINQLTNKCFHYQIIRIN